MKKGIALVLSLVMIFMLSSPVFANETAADSIVVAPKRWSTIISTSLNLTSNGATASMSSVKADLSISVLIYENGTLVKTGGNSKENAYALSASAPYSWKSNCSYEIIAYYNADGETDMIVKYR